MRSIDNWLDRFCRKHPRLTIPHLVQTILMGTALVFLVDSFSGNALSAALSFVPDMIFRGEVWRLVTFLFVPIERRILYFALELYFIWWSSSLIEREWGSGKLTVFYGTGVILNILVGLMMGGVLSLLGFGSGFVTASVSPLNLSLFFTFATLFPEMRILVFFILPVKVKWLGWFSAALLVYGILSPFFEAITALGLVFGLLWAAVQAVPALLAIANYFLFFWSDIMGFLGRARGKMRHRTSRQTVNFKKAARDAQETRGYTHQCKVCGRTDTEHPGLEFRYCSKCNGYHCYCMDHIGAHTHVQ